MTQILALLIWATGVSCGLSFAAVVWRKDSNTQRNRHAVIVAKLDGLWQRTGKILEEQHTMAVDAATASADLQASMAKVSTAVGSVLTQMQTEAQNILDLVAAAKAAGTGVDPATIETAAQNLSTLADSANATLATVQGQLNPPQTQPAQPATGQAAG